MKVSLRFIGNFAFILFLFLILFSFAMFQGGFGSWFLLFGFLPIFLYHIGLLLYPIKNWRVTRTLSRRFVRAGDEINVTVQIQRSIPFPLYYCIVEEMLSPTLNRIDNRKDKYYYMDDPNKLKVNRRIKKVIFPSFRRTIELSYRIEQIPRGEHELKAIRIKTGDVFGFIKRVHIFKQEDLLVAYPNEPLIQMAGQLSSFEQGSISSQSLHLKNTNVASGVREYLPGDKFSWIDWKQTARKNTVMTKEFEQEKSTDILLLLDSCYYEGMNYLAFEAAIEVTISLMEAIQRQAAQVGLLSIGEEVVQFPIHHDPTKKEWIRQHLTRIQPTGRHAFSVKLKEERAKIASGNILMLITTRIDGSFREMIQQMKQRSGGVIILYIQSSKVITQEDHLLIQQLQLDRVRIQVLTEKQLVKNPIEVRIS